MAHTNKIITGLISLCIVLTTVSFELADDSEAAATYTVKVYIGDGKTDTIGYVGSGATLRDVLVDALEPDHTISFKSNGTVLKLDDEGTTGTPGNSGYKPLCIYKWVPLNGWTLVYANALGDQTLENGASYYVYHSYAKATANGVIYPGPSSFKPISTGYFYVKMIEDVNANDYVKSVLTEDQRRAGFWISGQGSDMAEAFYDACNKLRESNPGFELDMTLTEGNDFKGWLNSFMGLKDVKLNEDEYQYWSQFYWDFEQSKWVYSQCMGHYDPGVMPYMSVIRQVTHKDSAEPVGTQYPSDIPAALKNGTDLTISYLGFDGTVAHTETVPYFGSLPDFNLDNVTLSNGDTVEFLGWNVPAGTGFRALSDMRISPLFDYDIVIEPSSGSQVTVDLTESDYLALSSSTITVIKTNASSVEFKVKGGSITLDGNAVSTLEDRSYAVTIASAPLSVLPGEVAEELKDSAVFEISLGGQHTFGEGKLNVSVNYTVPDGKDVSKLQVYHIVDGKKVPIQSSYSDGTLSFDVDSLSYFAVAYDAVPESNGGHSSMMLYVAIGAIAAIAAIGGVFLFLRKSKS